MAPFNHKKINGSIRRVLLLVGLGIPLVAVRAEFPDVSVFADAIEVDDSELAKMRGKFVSPGQITYFGVEMQTQWQTGSEVLSAGMRMNMNLPQEGNTVPVVNLVPTVSIVETAAPNVGDSDNFFPIQLGPPNTTISSSGLNNVSGVVQSIQAGGNESQIDNTIAMDITIVSSPVIENTDSQTLDLAPFSVQQYSDRGSVALAGVSQNGGIQVYTYVPDRGEILQRISGSPAGGGHIMQSVRLIGDQHRVFNLMKISASFSAINASTVNNTIQFDLKNFY